MQKGFAPMLFLIGAIVIALVAGGGIYWAQKINKEPSQDKAVLHLKQLSDTDKIIDPKSSANPNQNETANPDLIGANWKTHVSNTYGYSVQYPADMELIDCEGEGSCNFTFRLKNNDLLITFGAFGLPKNRLLVDYASLGFCHTSKDDVKQVSINGMIFYQTKEIFSESNICLDAITILKYQGNESSNWIVDIQAKAYSQQGIIIFNQILSTFKFLP